MKDAGNVARGGGERKPQRKRPDRTTARRASRARRRENADAARGYCTVALIGIEIVLRSGSLVVIVSVPFCAPFGVPAFMLTATW